MSTDAIAIVGCGLMGCDVAAIFLAAGWQVQAAEPDTPNWEARRQRVRASVAQLEGTFTPEHLRLAQTPSELDWTNVRLVLEAAPERLELKRQIFSELDRLVPAGIPIGSNASGYRITDIAGHCRTRSRMANLHFFAPAHLVPLVEVVRGEHTDASAVDTLYGIMKSVGRMPVRVNRDAPGFLANRIQHALMREAYAAIEEGLGTPEDVDVAVRYGFGFRYVAAGPILQKEISGLEVNLSAARSIYPSLSNNVEPSRVLKEVVAEGRLGLKTGRGFWKWTPEQSKQERERFERTLMAALKLMRGSKAPTEGS
jgi:3-hydroxybutyryl-CoA dehydrogenase